MRKAIFLLSALLLALPAHAADKVDCKNAQTQMDMDFCAGRDFTAADAQLNALYKKLVALLDAHERVSLVKAQRAWLAWRDAECDYRTISSEGGSIRPMLIGECDTELTANRIKDIKDQLKCSAGDLSCPAN